MSTETQSNFEDTLPSSLEIKEDFREGNSFDDSYESEQNIYEQIAYLKLDKSSGKSITYIVLLLLIVA